MGVGQSGGIKVEIPNRSTVAQMAARWPHNRKVVGSNPARSYETRFQVKDVLLLSHVVINSYDVWCIV